MIVSVLLNIITISIVGLFVLIIYMAYRKRPELTSTPLDVMRDIVGGQSNHTRIYKVWPFKRLLTGPVGEFGNYSNSDYSSLNGNSYEYTFGKKPWDGVENINFGSTVGVSDLTENQAIVQYLDTLYPMKGFDSINQSDVMFSTKIQSILNKIGVDIDISSEDFKNQVKNFYTEYDDSGNPESEFASEQRNFFLQNLS